MFDVFYIGKKPGLFPHEKSAESIQDACDRSSTRYCWIVNYLSDYSGWDWLWEPVPWQAHQRHAWPSQHQKDSETYLIPKLGYTETNYHLDPVIPRIKSSWTDEYEFDYTWHPDPTEPPMIYQFGTQWQRTGGPRYVIPGATEIKYVSCPREKTTAIHNCWNIPNNTNRDAFDWSWHPDDTEPPYRYQFGTQWNRAGGPEYVMPGATEIKFVTAQVAKMLPTDQNWQIPTGIDNNSFDFAWTPDPTEPPMIYQFGTQWQRTGGPRYVIPGATEIKYITTPRATKTIKDTHWIVPVGADIDSFDWTWHPDATEKSYIYQFGTQHQRTGGPQYHVPGADEIKYVDQIKIVTKRVATAIYEIDHLNGFAGKIIGSVRSVRYFDNYLDTLKRLANNIPLEHEFVWICSSVCDYKDFDFSWHPEQWQANMLHVFASDGEKFGDTFFMHVPTFRDRADFCQLLEWYNINFVENQSVPRRPLPVVKHNNDTHVDAIKTQSWLGPLAIFTNTDIGITNTPCVPLWREKTKTVVPLSKGASSVIIPKSAVGQIDTQVYDYPWINKTYTTSRESPLDIVFLSNGESNAEINWEHLKKCVPSHHQLHRIDGVNGRVKSEQAAASISNTSFYFRVPAKLKVEQTFDWNWQPDRLQQPKNYIFCAVNPVNNLEYGHMAIVAFNRALTLSTQGIELDFSMESLHEVVPLRSGIAMFAEDPWTAWRTAFRECIKLKHSLPDVENEYRLRMWLSNAGEVRNAEWSRWGAEDAVEYYNQANGDFTALKKSYEWSWLASYAFMKRGLVA